MFRLLGLCVVTKRMTSSFLVVSGCPKTSKGISLAFNMQVSINDFENFCSSNVFLLQSAFLSHFHSQQWYILFLQEKMVYLLNNAVGGLMQMGHSFESVGLL